MSDPYSTFFRKKKGVSERVSSKPSKNEEERVLKDETTEANGRGFLSPEPMGSIGMSINVGMATKFMREKIDIAVWESRPVSDSPADRERVKQEIYHDLVKDAEERLDGCIRQFFPRFLEDAKEEG